MDSPANTGRSTNCLINDAGIYVHQRKEGYHNYALPYSWDVRMGHKTRDVALAELNDSLDVSRIHQMLDEIGYDEEIVQPGAVSRRLVAYYSSKAAVEEGRLREHLSRHLPETMVPAHLVAMQALPPTDNGKIDRAALPVPVRGRPPVESVYRAPRSELEKQLAGIGGTFSTWGQ